MKFAKIILCVCLAVFTGVGCQEQRLVTEQSQIVWKEVADGVERIEVPLTHASGTALIAYAFDPNVFSFDFAYSTSAKTIATWISEYPAAEAVVNGVYFHEDYTPSGDLIDDRVRVTERAFDLDKSAYLVLDPDFGISTTTGVYREAGQSYPVLVRGGEPAVSSDSGKTARRTFAGVRKDGMAVFGILDEAEISLYELSRELARAEFGLAAALNLDGGSSSGMMVRDPEESMNSIFPVPVVIVIRRK